jgi:hypothetical protein
MVRLAAPALSIDASGSLAESIVFSKWKGRNYARTRVIPSNPRSGGQVGIRAMFMFLTKQWAGLTAGNKATWNDRAAAGNVSPFNGFVQYNQSRWRNYLTPSKQEPAAESSSAPSAPTVVATAGVRQVSLAITKGATAPSWGYAIFRSKTTGFTPMWSNCIAVVAKDASSNGSYIDTPLAPGTYYYKALGFNDDGVKGALSNEASATVT